jgi:hypothetical protein
MDDLRKYGGLKLAIKKESENLHRIKREAFEFIKQKQDVLAYCQIAVYLTNYIDSKISYWRNLIDYCHCSHHDKDEPYKAKFTPPATNPTSLPIIVVFIGYNKSENNGPDNSENEGNDKENGQQAK